MDKLTQLKNQVIDKYATVIAKAQKGYLLQNYSLIMDAMKAINFITNFSAYPSHSVTATEDYYLRKLNQL